MTQKIIIQLTSCKVKAYCSPSAVETELNSTSSVILSLWICDNEAAEFVGVFSITGEELESLILSSV